MAISEVDTGSLTQGERDFEQQVADVQAYFDSPRFEGITRLYAARQVVEQRGTIPSDHIVRPPPPSTRGCANCSPRRRASPRSGRTRRARRW